MDQILDNEYSKNDEQVSFFNDVYSYMAFGLGLTALVALLAVNMEWTRLISNSGLMMPLFLVELGLVWFLSARIHKMSFSTGILLFVVYAAINGLTLSSIFFAYSTSAIASTFFITAGTFVAMSVYGYTTNKDLSKIGSLLMMALIGLIIASIVNYFLHSGDGFIQGETRKKYALMGALSLYLDFINLFIFLLKILGGRD